ncbi:hypothetical protein ACOMHN_022555 [Nucella lapillus]
MNAIDFYIFWTFFSAVIPPRFQAIWTLFLLHLVSFLWYQPAPCLQQLSPPFFSPALSYPLHYSSPPPPTPVPSVYPLRHYPPPLPSPPSSNLPMRYSRDQLLEIQPSTPNFELVNRLRELRLGVGLPRKRGCRGGRKKLRSIQVVPSRNLHPLMVPPFLQPHPDLQSAVGNAPLSSKHPTQLPTTDCLLSIIPLMGGQPSDAPALSPPSPLQQGGQSSNAPALSPPSPLPQGGQPIALALSPSSPPPQDGQPSDAPGLSPSSSTLLLCPSDSTLSICHLNSQSAVKNGKPETISDYIIEQKLDIMILTETWLSETGHETSCKLMTPSGFVLKSYPRASKGDVENGYIKGSADIIEVAREFQREAKLSEEETAKIVAAKMMADKPKRSGWYRVSATRALTGGHRLAPRVNTTFDELFEKIRAQTNAESVRKMSMTAPDPTMFLDKAVVEFTSATCAVLENEGHVRLGIRRYGNMEKDISVGVETIDGTAEAGEDYKPVKKLITFKANESLKDVFVEIVDDDVWEPDEFFYVKLYHDPQGSTDDQVAMGKVCINQITIVNDDEPGKFEWSKPSYIVKESAEQGQLTVKRVNGADGEVMVTWRTKDLSAKAGREYVGNSGKVTFNHGETSKSISVGIIGIQASEHEPNFQVELSSPSGGAEIGKIPKAIVTIINDEEFSSMVSRIAAKTQKNMEGLQLDTNTWGEQFFSAMNVNGGEVDTASKVDYVLHFITFFWKVLFAFIPPTSIGGGWLTFGVALFWIGVLTIIISDLASVFGCVVGLSDTITAITFVALGTSMPDTFASRAAALNEKYADSSIGNINGSNAVNVFLGLGLPWVISCIYWKVKGGKLTVKTSSIGFSVTLFAVLALLTVTLLMCRRMLKVFGKAELGGKKTPKIASALLVGFFWVLYIVLSCLQAQNVIDVGF